jgi:hypothetical protein
MTEDVYLFDEFTAVKMLFEKTQVEYIRPGWSETTALVDYPSRELLEILRSEGDRTKVYLLDNGPTGNMPGVYRLNENGEINPCRLYVPLSESTDRSRSPLDKPLRLQC